MSLPQVKSISDYSNINVSDIFTFSLPLHTRIPLQTESLRSLVYVSTTCTVYTRSCVIEMLIEYTRLAFAMLMKETETLIKDSSRYTSRKKTQTNLNCSSLSDLHIAVTLERCNKRVSLWCLYIREKENVINLTMANQ